MVHQSLPWGSTSPGDAGPYSDSTWADLYRALMAADQVRRGPLYSDQNDALEVSERAAGANMTVQLAPGAAMVNGRIMYDTNVQGVAIAAAHATLDRIDIIVLESNTSTQTIIATAVQGTPGASPSPPALDTSGSPKYQVPLARVAVAAGATSITDANITDVRSFANIPQRLYTEITNKSGGELLPGNIVVWDDANTQAVTTTTTQDDYRVAGVIADVIANDGTGRMCVTGLYPVDVDGAVSVGDGLVTGTTAKQATLNGSNAIGRVMVATAGAGKALTLLQVKPAYPAHGFAYLHSVATQSPSSAATWEDIDATNLSITLQTHGGDVELWANCPLLHGAADCAVMFDFTYDTTRWGNAYAGGYGIASMAQLITDVGPQSTTIGPIRVTGLAPGSHTFRLQWYGPTTVTLYGLTTFYAREILA